MTKALMAMWAIPIVFILVLVCNAPASVPVVVNAPTAWDIDTATRARMNEFYATQEQDRADMARRTAILSYIQARNLADEQEQQQREITDRLDTLIQLERNR